jgi:hypothetical protein
MTATPIPITLTLPFLRYGMLKKLINQKDGKKSPQKHADKQHSRNIEAIKRN